MDGHIENQALHSEKNIIPLAMAKNRNALSELVEKHPVYLPVEALSKFLGMKPEALRACIRQGHCPFGVAYSVGSRFAYKIFTTTFLAWYLKLCA